MNTRKMVVVAGAAAVLGLAGCTGKTETAPTMSVPESPIVVTSSAPPTVADGPVTPGGTTLAIGETARVMHETVAFHDTFTKLAFTVDSVTQGSAEDLADLDVDDNMDAYYVTMTFKNFGPVPLAEPVGLFANDVYTAADEEMDWLMLTGEFPTCPQPTWPGPLQVGESMTGCMIYAGTHGQGIGRVVASYYADHGGFEEITWAAE